MLAHPRAAAPEDDPAHRLLAEADEADRRIVTTSLQYSMTSAPRMLALVDAVRYCVARQLSGAFAECGVWRGGSILAMILTLQELSVTDRDIYLYDTFEGMTAPGEHDLSSFDPPARETWQEAKGSEQRPWSELFSPETFNEEAVRSLLEGTGYPQQLLHFVRGPVEQTLPEQAPSELALLRLDTDWYESTHHELEHLLPRLTPAGVLLIDDYGHWKGARRAVDEYLAEVGRPLLLSRIDYTGRIAVNS